jgi:hypothetical protein
MIVTHKFYPQIIERVKERDGRLQVELRTFLNSELGGCE